MELVQEMMDEARRQKITQLQLAEMVNVSAQAVAQWSNGTKKPTDANLMSMANALGLEIITRRTS